MSRAYRRFRDLPIRRKLRLINLVTTGVAALLIVLVLIGIEHVSYRRSLLDEARLQAAKISEYSLAALSSNDERGAAESLAALKLSPGIWEAALYNGAGIRLAVYQQGGRADAEGGRWPQSPEGEGYRFTWDRLELFHAVRLQDKTVGTLYVSSGLGRLYARMLWYAGAVCVAMLVATVVMLVLVERLQRTITGPLTQIAALMREVSLTKDYSKRLDINRLDELGELAYGFNAMLEQIEQRDVDLELELGERRRAEERLDYLAHYDTITHLPNRHYFNDKLRLAIPQALGSGRPLGLMFVDLDNFKIVNDTLGHTVGDGLLSAVAARLREALRHGDTICRVGGDEFAVILESLAAREDTGRVAQKLISLLTSPFEVDGHEIYVTASVGLSVCPDDGTEGDILLRHADTAMYYAKEKGKNTWQYFTGDMKDRALKRMRLETALRHALERNEFVLHYQPQYDLMTRRILGVEALLRWQHPELGMVSPAEFIPVAEESGLIVPIGAWVLHAACAQAKDWENRGVSLPVSVNISGRQFREEDFVDRVRAAMEEAGLPARLLTLELTESILMDDSAATLDRLRSVVDAGLRLSIDDFGTGYSSMSYLKRFPLTELKIDRSFVRDLTEDNDDAAITEGIIGMARGLKLEVVAEGVETAAQAEFLRARGVKSVQGYYFSRPLPTVAMTALLRENRREQCETGETGPEQANAAAGGR